MRKKPTYHITLRRQEVVMQMEIQYHRKGTTGWVVTYEGLELGSVYGKEVKYRDALVKAIESNIGEYWMMNLVEKLCNIHTIPKREKEHTHYSDDEIWFTHGTIRSGDLKVGTINIPKWRHPSDVVEGLEYASSSGCPVHCYMALKRFLKKPENQKKLKLQKVAQKFGI